MRCHEERKFVGMVDLVDAEVHRQRLVFWDKQKRFVKTTQHARVQEGFVFKHGNVIGQVMDDHTGLPKLKIPCPCQSIGKQGPRTFARRDGFGHGVVRR